MENVLDPVEQSWNHLPLSTQTLTYIYISCMQIISLWIICADMQESSIRTVLNIPFIHQVYLFSFTYASNSVWFWLGLFFFPSVYQVVASYSITGSIFIDF